MDELLPPELTARPSKMIGMEDDPFHFEMVPFRVNIGEFFVRSSFGSRNLQHLLLLEFFLKKNTVVIARGLSRAIRSSLPG